MQGEQDQPQQHNNQDGKVNQHGQQQHHEPLKCPRCESLNTKFCYYNNYSLSQPRYFCKGCRRYWTHGGTLRNVPVGGGCRKGKRAKSMSSTSSSCSVFIQPQQQPPDHHHRSLMMSSGPSVTLNSLPGSQYYPGGAGYLTSLPFSQNITHLGGTSQLGSGAVASNLGLFHSFTAISPYGQRHMQSPFFRTNMEPSTLYTSKDHQSMLLQPTKSSGVMTDWSQSFINKSHASASNVAASTCPTVMWNASIRNNISTTNGADPSINSTQWPDDLAGSFAVGPPQ